MHRTYESRRHSAVRHAFEMVSSCAITFFWSALREASAKNPLNAPFMSVGTLEHDLLM